MKKIFLLSLFAILSSLGLKAQEPGEFIAQPKDIVGRKVNALGEITKEYEASFSYDSDGKLQDFTFPEWGVYSTFLYDDNCLSNVLTRHEGMWPYYSDAYRFTYQDGRIMTEAHEWDGMNSNDYTDYSYYDDGRLLRKDYASYQPEQIHNYSLFDYQNDGKTKIESYYWVRNYYDDQLEYQITSQYDDDFTIVSKQKDTYNSDGEITNSTRTVFSYTEQGLLETECSQNLVDNEWINTKIHSYAYDDNGRITEQLFGDWSDEFDEWYFNNMITYEYSENFTILTVTFYKKSGDEWVYDVFDNQTLFVEPILKWQQNRLTCFAYEDLMGSAQINQFEFRMVMTKTPNYMSTEENGQTDYAVYPNPGKEDINISAPVENSVVRFYDLQGRLMLAKPFDFNTTINTDKWTPGIYFWEIWSGTQREASGKWIKK